MAKDERAQRTDAEPRAEGGQAGEQLRPLVAGRKEQPSKKDSQAAVQVKVVPLDSDAATMTRRIVLGSLASADMATLRRHGQTVPSAANYVGQRNVVRAAERVVEKTGRGRIESLDLRTGAKGVQMIRSLLGGVAFGSLLLLAAAFAACETAETLCIAGEEVFCKCPGGLEGTKTCLDDGASYGPCASPEGECAELICGDGFADPDLGEECDDGNFDDLDGCLSDCTLAKCGDGILAGVEDCDDGNAEDTDACVTGCIAATCGDGFTQAGVEDCDDGNEEDGDACSSVCAAGAGCGNGEVDAGEDCDDGNRVGTDDCVDCVAAFCGDGQAQLGTEECDDGNDTDDDSCNNGCVVNVPTTFGCPGIAADVAPGPGITLGGNTADAASDYIGSCGGDESPEIVYAFTATASGVMTVEMLAINNDLDPVLYVKTDCEGSATLVCADSTFQGGAEELTFAVSGGTTYYVFADGYFGTTGEFLLAGTLSTMVPGDDCPGQTVAISDFNDTQSFSGDTSAANPDRNGTGLCNSPSTKDIVYKVVAGQTGTLIAALDPSYDASLYVRTPSCTATAGQIDCSEVGGVGALETTSVPVTAGSSYYVIVDGNSGSAGQYNLELTILPP